MLTEVKKLNVLMIYSIISIYSSQTFANETILCAQTFTSQQIIEKDGPTNEFIAYMSSLLEEGVISSDELIRFKNNLENEIILNPISMDKIFYNPSSQIHFQGLQEFLKSENLNKKWILDWIQNFLKAEHKSSKRKLAVSRNTKNKLYLPIKFEMVELRPNLIIDIMNTPVTQKHWVDEMEYNPSFFSVGVDSEIVFKRGRKITLQANHPVENITLFSALVFANQLSKKHGLVEFYDLQSIHWDDTTSAAQGTLNPEYFSYGTSYLKQIKWNRLANGYRLPTLNEKSLLNLYSTIYIDNHPTVKNLIHYGWFMENSTHQTHSIGFLKPIIVNNKMLLDLLGNAEEWYFGLEGDASDWQNQTFRMFSFKASIFQLANVPYRPYIRQNDLGLRLVRNNPENQ